MEHFIHIIYMVESLSMFYGILQYDILARILFIYIYFEFLLLLLAKKFLLYYLMMNMVLLKIFFSIIWVIWQSWNMFLKNVIKNMLSRACQHCVTTLPRLPTSIMEDAGKPPMIHCTGQSWKVSRGHQL